MARTSADAAGGEDLGVAGGEAAAGVAIGARRCWDGLAAYGRASCACDGMDAAGGGAAAAVFAQNASVAAGARGGATECGGFFCERLVAPEEAL